MRNEKAFVLCMVAGPMLISVGYIHGVNTIVLLYTFLHSIAALAPLFFIIDLVLFVLWIIAFSGGVAVIFGGFILTTSHIRLGKFVIAVAAGFGLISLILTVLWVGLVAGWTGLLVLTFLIVNTGWAIALILTIIARSIAQ